MKSALILILYSISIGFSLQSSSSSSSSSSHSSSASSVSHDGSSAHGSLHYGHSGVEHEEEPDHEILFNKDCLQCKRDKPNNNYCLIKNELHACCPPDSKSFFCTHNEAEGVICNIDDPMSPEMYYASCPIDQPSQCGIDSDYILNIEDDKKAEVHAS